MNELNYRINQHILNRKPSVVFIDKSSNNQNSDAIDDIVVAFNTLTNERNELSIQYNKLKQELDSEYSAFNEVNNTRIEKLFEYYEKYATEFLGIKCSLTPIKSDDRLLDLHLFVPIFNGRTRETPESCSEAQRFFLDIAFRLALIHLIGELSNSEGTFICETPENALDITYIGNVSDMFESFSRNKNTLLLSCNIQSEGLAQSLLKKVQGVKNKQMLFLNMIRIGNLSEVQASEEGQRLLNREIAKILKQK